ncbi:MAG: molybdenum cofactor guanylyltransferase [Pirellulaceae bacterium]
MNDPVHRLSIGGILLCGGKSSRMRQAKALLPFGNSTMVEHVLSTLQEIVQPVVVVTSREQQLPALQNAMIVTDDRSEKGPLEAMRVGLGRLPKSCRAAFITSCDVPLLRTAFVRYLADRLGDYDAIVPFDGKFAHPLAGIYRTAVVPTIERLISADRWRPRFLIDEVNTLRVDVEELRTVDPDLESLMNVNEPSDYQAVLRRKQK